MDWDSPECFGFINTHTGNMYGWRDPAEAKAAWEAELADIAAGKAEADLGLIAYDKEWNILWALDAAEPSVVR